MFSLLTSEGSEGVSCRFYAPRLSVETEQRTLSHDPVARLYLPTNASHAPNGSRKLWVALLHRRVSKLRD